VVNTQQMLCTVN